VLARVVQDFHEHVKRAKSSVKDPGNKSAIEGEIA